MDDIVKHQIHVYSTIDERCVQRWSEKESMSRKFLPMIGSLVLAGHFLATNCMLSVV
jgi:hypothetical protein